MFIFNIALKIFCRIPGEKSMNVEKRHQMILELLERDSYADISTLSRMLQVSEMTIRRDLSRMDEEGLLLRVHGGARPVPKRGFELPIEQRTLCQPSSKSMLGRYAASLVQSGEVIALDASSTTCAMIPYLNVPVTVITNSISAACALAENAKAEVILLGGRLRKPSFSLVGYDVGETLRKYHVDKAFLSSKSIDAPHGVTDATADEAESKKAILASAAEVFFLMDHTKLDSCAFYQVCPLPQAGRLIVDFQPGIREKHAEFFSSCEKSSVKVQIISEGIEI